jgi:putative addiction module killer protein
LYSLEYNAAMFSVRRTPQFDAWFASLRDGTTRRRLALRLRKAQLGNLGDVRPVGAGVSEMREHFGPGWRMYYVQRGAVIVVMLGGGSKATQPADIAAAQALAATLED